MSQGIKILDNLMFLGCCHFSLTIVEYEFTICALFWAQN